MAKSKRKASEALTPILDAGRALKVGDLAEEMISALGGPKKFAKLYATEIEEGTKPGSVSRARMLDGVLRIVSQASAQNKSLQRAEDQMSDEELTAIMDDFLRRRTPSAPEEAADG